MAEYSHIEWTDATWNPITGCSVVSPGCTNCYAMRLAGTRLKHHPSRAGLTTDTKAGPVWNGEVRFNENWAEQPLSWRKPSNIFVCAHADLFHEGVPTPWIDRVFAVMALATHHQFQVLSKRSARMLAYTIDPGTPERVWYAAGEIRNTLHALAFNGAAWGGATPWPLRNVWKGISAEDQPRFDERIADLRKTPAAIRFVSFEPLLSRIGARGALNDIDWAIVGGENGPRATHPDWVRELRDACDEAGTAFFFKQWGTHAWAERVEGDPSTLTAYRAGKKLAGRMLDGRTHDDMPEAR